LPACLARNAFKRDRCDAAPALAKSPEANPLAVNAKAAAATTAILENLNILSSRRNWRFEFSNLNQCSAHVLRNYSRDLEIKSSFVEKIFYILSI
jgi:hypothetical protein